MAEQWEKSIRKGRVDVKRQKYADNARKNGSPQNLETTLFNIVSKKKLNLSKRTMK